jgi:hypothetical protein
MIHQNLLRYRSARYLWWGLALILISAVLYATQDNLRGANGGTWQGYTLGTASALLIVWLAWFGVRKRRYVSGSGSVQGWASAHVYLGTTLVVIATLHCAAQFGWNVHTLAYALMCVVIVSGMCGLYLYLSFPRDMSANREGGPRSQLFAELYELDARARELARKCDAAINIAVRSSIERTAIGGGVYRQLLGGDQSLMMSGAAESGAKAPVLISNADQQAVVAYVSNRVPRAEKRAEAATLQALVVILCRRQAVLRRIRRDIRLQGWLNAWLHLHVPLTLALIAALIVHIVTTFIYW